ncbi:tellurite resistance TerB family protein [Archangium violaceum]|uniref:tellurite resistance TerB family protein n=1 Tax=Archangium violaceum TaxID=83451 RepID=UPI00193C01A3|nr:tellurite resistance TerB family protein [Archangium violaceum]QRK10505.1 tellurite resistance TerB family protein [Archangium violaceum]
MGLLSRFRSAAPAKRPSDDVLLMLSMLLMSGADGYFDESEVGSVAAFVGQLPEFKGKELEELIAQASKLANKYSNFLDAVESLRELSSDTVKRKAFVLAADLAMSSGEVDEAEDELLTRMQRILGVDDFTAQKVLEVLAMKYAR